MHERIVCSVAMDKSTQLCSVRTCVRTCVRACVYVRARADARSICLRMSAFAPACTYVRACLDACFGES